MDLPVALGMLVTFVVSMLGTFDPKAVRARGRLIADHVRVLPAHRPLAGAAPAAPHGALDAVMNRLPSVWRTRPDGRRLKTCRRVGPRGRPVRVLPGEAFPADGVLHRKATTADEAC